MDTELEKRLIDIEKRLTRIEGIIHPALISPVYPETLKAKPTCPTCKMVFDGVTGYVCNNPDCPMGCGPTIC